MKKKIVKKYADLFFQAYNPTGRKEVVVLIHEAAKLKTKSVTTKQYSLEFMINKDT